MVLPEVFWIDLGHYRWGAGDLNMVEVCLVCVVVPFLIYFSEMMGIPLPLTFTLIGVLALFLCYKTDDLLRHIKVKRYSKKRNVTTKKARSELARQYRTSYIPFQLPILVLVTMIFLWITYIIMGLI